MKINNKSISIAFVIILAATVIISLAGILLMSRQPLFLQGQVEATEIRISGKLPGRVDSFLVQEGDWVKAGDTLVVINSPTIEAKYRQENALEQVAQEQNKKNFLCTPARRGKSSPLCERHYSLFASGSPASESRYRYSGISSRKPARTSSLSSGVNSTPSGLSS